MILLRDGGHYGYRGDEWYFKFLDLAFTDEQRIYFDKLYADQPVSISSTVSLNYVKRLTNPKISCHQFSVLVKSSRLYVFV